MNEEEEMKNDAAIVMTAVQQDWRAREHASEEMKHNETIVTAAVEKDGGALRFALEEMNNNEAPRSSGPKSLQMECLACFHQALVAQLMSTCTWKVQEECTSHSR